MLSCPGQWKMCPAVWRCPSPRWLLLPLGRTQLVWWGEVPCAPAWETPCEPKLPIVPSRKRCISLWSTVTKAPWKRCHGWGSRSMSFACTPSRSQLPSTSSMSTASSTVTSKVHVVPPHALTPVHCPHTHCAFQEVYISVYLDAPEPHISVFGVREIGRG